MYPRREVFDHSPLALVAAEVRFTDALLLRQQEIVDQIALALADSFPYARPLPQPEFQIVLGNEPPQTPGGVGVVVVNEAGTSSLTLSQNSLIFETTTYTRFEDLLGSVALGCDALISKGILPAIERVGLRFIDEIRVPSAVEEPSQWRNWVSPRLIDQLAIGPSSARAMGIQGVVTFGIGPQQGLTFRFAALNQDPVVSPKFLRRAQYEAGPFFVLDIDAFEDFTTGAPTKLDGGEVTRSLTAVHGPAGEVFQNSITEQARILFRGGTR